MKNNKLFPVYFNGKQYFENDCDEMFLSIYDCKDALNHLGGVYLTDGLWVYPDGSMGEF